MVEERTQRRCGGGAWARVLRLACTAVAGLLGALSQGSCAPSPLVKFTTDVPPLVLTTTGQAGIQDERGRFREIFCAVNEAHGAELPDHRPCEDALVRLSDEPPPSGRPVHLGMASSDLHLVTVPGYSWTCIEGWADSKNEMHIHLASLGWPITHLPVSAFSSSEHNAGEIRDALANTPELPEGRRLLFIGHSKGIVDILEALVAYPEVAERAAAVVSLAGAVGGSVLADDPPKLLVEAFQDMVGDADCERGDGRALESLRPAARRSWLSRSRLPSSVRYYSVVAFPDRSDVSTLLRPNYDLLSQVDPRNDGQLIFYDQVIPHGALMGYVRGDHWAVAAAIGRSRPFVTSIFAEKNPFPREVLIESIVRHVEEQQLRSAGR